MNNMFLAFYDALRPETQQSFVIEAADKADTWNSTGFVPGYDHLSPERDCGSMNQYAYIYYQTPGITEAAGSEWFDEISNIAWECGIFGIRGVVFPNLSDLTIDNLLSENYTTQYLQRRFTRNGRNYISDLQFNSVNFQDIRLVDSYEGVDGLTNSFAAAIWAVELSMEWAIISGYRLHFFNPMQNASFQSILGQAPHYGPGAMFYGLILAIVSNHYAPTIIRPTMTAGTSQSIKVYHLSSWMYTGVLILNKDTNASRSGTVGVRMTDTTGLQCVYVSAPSLSSTSGFSFGGYSFVSNTSVPEGLFSQVEVLADGSGIYNVPLNYSQMAFCRTFDTSSNSYRRFPRWSQASSW